jgi:DNA-binding IclR family transcriptional regulator
VFHAFGAEVPGADMSSAELARVRSTRVAVNSRVVQGIRAIATPIFQDTELTAAMAIVGTTASIPADPRSPLARELRDAAGVLSAELGFAVTEVPPTERRSG